MILGTMMCGMSEETTDRPTPDAETDAAALLSLELAGEADPELSVEPGVRQGLSDS
jgi:hypothetical protein